MATTRIEKNGTTRNGESQRRPPIWSRKFWPVEVAVFEYSNGDGRPSHSVKLSKSFRRDPDSDWESTDYLSASDLLAARKLLRDAYQFVQARLQKAFASRQDTSEPLSEVESAAETTPF